MRFFIFSAENVGFLKTQISPPPKKQTKYLAKKTKKRSSKARQGHMGTLNTCAKFQGLDSQKRRGHWHLKEFGVLCLNQPVEVLLVDLCKKSAKLLLFFCGRCNTGGGALNVESIDGMHYCTKGLHVALPRAGNYMICTVVYKFTSLVLEFLKV